MARKALPPRLDQLDGVWYVKWTEGGRSQRTSLRTADLQLAQSRFQGWLEARQKHEEAQKAPNFALAYKLYLEQHGTRRTESPESLEHIGKRLCWYFGDMRLEDISAKDIQDYTAKRRKGINAPNMKLRAVKDGTIRKELGITGPVQNLRIAMVGDLKYGRTVHSLSKLLSLYHNIHFTLVAPKELGMPGEIVEQLLAAGHTVVETESMEEGLHDNDTVYLTRIQEERFSDQKEADIYRGRFRLNQEIYTRHCKPNTVIMHPLPRDSRDEANELDNDLNQNPKLAIFRQTDNGVLVRMALFALTLDVWQQIERTSREVNWYTERRF